MCRLYHVSDNICTLKLTFSKFISIFLRSIRSKQYRQASQKVIDSSCSFFLLWLVFAFVAGLFFMIFPYRVYCNRQHMLQIFRHFSFCVAIVKLLQTLRLFESFLLNYCSPGVTELYPIFIHCETKPYLSILPSYTLS